MVKDLSVAFKNGVKEETSLTMATNDGIITRITTSGTAATTAGGDYMDYMEEYHEAPCVEDENWYFVAPPSYTGNIQAMYDGSMEFMLRIAQSSGVDRDYHGFITMKASDGTCLFLH